MYFAKNIVCATEVGHFGTRPIYLVLAPKDLSYLLETQYTIYRFGLRARFNWINAGQIWSDGKCPIFYKKTTETYLYAWYIYFYPKSIRSENIATKLVLFTIAIGGNTFFSCMHRNGHFFCLKREKKIPFLGYTRKMRELLIIPLGIINNSHIWGNNYVICVSTVIFSSFFAASSVVHFSCVPQKGDFLHVFQAKKCPFLCMHEKKQSMLH